jgi:RimJ/RimL family protein N-acetyltransferase
MRATFGRVTLRPVGRADFAQIESWYGSALTLAHAERSLEARCVDSGASGYQLLAICEKGETDVVGLLDYRVHQPADGWLTTVFIAIADGRRGFGYGSEAVRALEASTMKSHKVTSFLADVSVHNGLGLYFWLRVGYRPAHEGEVFWRAPNEGGIIAMIRSH